MIRLNERAPVIGALGLLWYECGQDFALFCYRVGCGAFTVFRSRSLDLEPGSQVITETPMRNNDACSNLSFICSAPSTTQMDSRN
jgi:hypothetical protein